jgi:hypothetical protein
MGWSEKYKKSINCDNPKGFSQRAHCQGRKKKMNEGKEKQDHEVSMAKTQVKKSIDNLQKVARVLAKKTDADNLPAWVQAKLTDTEHNTSAAADYMGEEKKKCGDGEYWCKTDEKCKKIPKGHHVMGNGDLMKDSEHEDNGGDVSEVYDSRNPIDKGNPDSSLRRAVKKLGDDPKKVIPSSNLPLANSHEPEGEFLEEKKKKGGTLHNWFKKSKSKDGKPGWVQSDGSPCANEEGETKTPKCYSSRRLAGLKKTEKGKKKIRSADARKSRKDPGQQQKSGGAAPTMVRTFTDKKDYKKHKSGDYSAEGFEMQEARDVKGKGSGKKDACYHKVKSRYSVWPSAYASGALVKCRKVGAANWGTKSESFQYSNWREDFKALEIETVDLIKAEPLVNEEGGIIDTVKSFIGLTKNKDMKVKPTTPMGQAVTGLQNRRQKTDKAIQDLLRNSHQPEGEVIGEGQKCWKGYEKKGTKKMFGKTYNNCVKKEEFSNWREELAESGYDSTRGRGEGRYQPTEYLKVDPEKRKKSMDFWKQHLQTAPPVRGASAKSAKKDTQVAHFEPEGEIIEGAAWTRKEGQNKKGGLNEKGRKSYERENPGSDLKRPSKKKGNKRRKSFCARMKGMKKKLTSKKTANDPDSRINKSLRAWNC